MGVGLTFGSDPEFVIVDGNLAPKSAIKVFPGHGKESKIPIGDQAIFYDNVLLEFNLRPARTLMEFNANFKECLIGASKILKKKNLYLRTRASLNFPALECEDDDACVFGCEPEFCIYNRTSDNKIMRVDPPIMEPGSTFRSCGGHIHIGHVMANWETGGDPATVIKLMDAFVGVVSVFLDKDESSAARKKLYGGAGSHRVTPYGVEYRTLSNFWLSDPKLTEIIYKLTRLVMEKVLTNPTVIDDVIDLPSLQKLVNEGSPQKALSFYEHALEGNLPFELQHLIDTCMDCGYYDLPQKRWAPLLEVAA